MSFELFHPNSNENRSVGFIHDTRPKDNDYNLLPKLTFEHSTSFIIAPTLQAYKRSLLIKLLYCFVLFLLFIFERTFHHTLQNQELSLIFDLQTFWFGRGNSAFVKGFFF